MFQREMSLFESQLSYDISERFSSSMKSTYYAFATLSICKSAAQI